MNKKCIVNPNSHQGFSSEREGSKNRGFPPGYESGVSRTTMHCTPLARHSGVAARATILYPYDTRFYDVMGLSAFSSFPLIGFCWTEEG